jgi:hypothetical protein
MRSLASKDNIAQFMRFLGRVARSECRVYFAGGTTAVLSGWRDTTVDIDFRFEPELDEVFRAIPEIKERLQINLELAAPSDFIPEVPGWRDRCRFVGREGKVSFYNYDPYSQALAKIERGHTQDTSDVESMLRNGLIDRTKLLALFQAIKPFLYKYPAIDVEDFEKAVLSIAEERLN